MSGERVFTVEVSGLSTDVDDDAVRAALASAVARLHRRRGGLSVGTSGGAALATTAAPAGDWPEGPVPDNERLTAERDAYKALWEQATGRGDHPAEPERPTDEQETS